MKNSKTSIKRLCWCKNEKTGKSYPEGKCPKLSNKGHGSFWFRLEAPSVEGRGRRQPRYGPYKTYREAQEALVEEARRIRLGRGGLDKNLLYSDFLEMWLEAKKHLKSWKAYEDIVRLYANPALGHVKLVELRPAHFLELAEEIRKINRKNKAGEVPTEMGKRLIMVRVARNSRGRGERVNFDKPVALSTIHKIMAVLSSSMTYAVQIEAIDRNPMRSLPIPKLKKKKPLLWTDGRVLKWRSTGVKPAKVMVWTPEQSGAFLDCIEQHRLYPLLHLVMLTGLRRSEVVGLSWSEVDLNGGWMMIRRAVTSSRANESPDEWEEAEGEELGTKSEAGERCISLGEANIAVLKSWKRKQNEERLKAGRSWKDTGLVFTQADGGQLSPHTLVTHFLDLIRQHDFPPVSFHGLRHGSATIQLAAGVDPKVISENLGHAFTSFTLDTYVHVMPEMQRKAAEATAAMIPRRLKNNRPATS